MENNRVVLFDLDGVLVLTEHLKAEAHAAAIRHLGGDVSPSFYGHLMGQSHEAVRGAFLAAAHIRADPYEYTRFFRSKYRELLETRLEVVPGIVELLHTLTEKGYLLSVVSSSSSELMGEVLDRVALTRFFRVQVSADDVFRKKPAPDAYLKALDLLGVSPASAVVIEDSESGVQAAVNAGILVLAIRHSFNRGHNFANALAVFDLPLDAHAITQKIDTLLMPWHEQVIQMVKEEP